MTVERFVINDIGLQPIGGKIADLKGYFDELTYSHIPVEDNDVFIGSIAENDVRCFDSDKTLAEYRYNIERFYVRNTDNWLDVLEAFAKNNTNVMPVLDGHNVYVGYVELGDVISMFNETPFLSEGGAIIVVEKGYADFSFSEISQIVESNGAKIFGMFISKIENDVVQVTLKLGAGGINEILQSFRRYNYNVESSHQEDTFYENLKDRSRYLQKYLNI
ncbi:CBS domain-containing protein [Gangjinia marincola]|uniref:CBS domain-containing protein n=1 Tax=Gangjinia marincola TaxID=578463 RepID=A0ABN1MEH3_9FLAO